MTLSLQTVEIIIGFLVYIFFEYPSQLCSDDLKKWREDRVGYDECLQISNAFHVHCWPFEFEKKTSNDYL